MIYALVILAAAVVYLILDHQYNKDYIEAKTETQFLVEQKIRRDISHQADFWDNFNISLYVEYLEDRKSVV